jgi:hypothetical protein
VVKPRLLASSREPFRDIAMSVYAPSRALVATVTAAGLLLWLLRHIYVVGQCKLPPTQLAFTHRMVSQTIIALKAYEKDTGEEPDSLADLVPKYLPALHQDAWGRDLIYVREVEAEDAIFSFGADGRPDGEGLDSDIHADTDIRGLANEVSAAMGCRA